jgi:bifunctional UDP-N-acetylglucosamine pyrophosphorylase/glucosamine-1-phosphate N-acetyltransferase
MTPHDLFDVDAVAEELRHLLDVHRPWEVLAQIDAFCDALVDLRAGTVHPSAVVEGTVYLDEGAIIGPHAYVKGPSWIGRGAEVGHGAYLRGYVVLAPGARVLHASEVKRSLLLEGARAPHFNYIGDSVLGREVNIGAGVKLANFKAFGDEIGVAGESTGLRKFGAALGDGVSIGCNAVLAPGTVVGARSVVYHGATVGGVVASDTVVKLRQVLEQAPRRP